MSQQYTVTTETTLEQVAARVYGDPSLWPRIQRANAIDTLYPGAVLIIPGVSKARDLPNRNPYDLTVVIDGYEVPLMDARLLRTMDTGADAWSGRIAWTPGRDPIIDRITRPYSYADAAAYIGGKLRVNGRLYIVSPELSTDGRTKALTGFSFTADAIDSTVKPPYERNGITLEQLAAELLEPIGIKAVFRTATGGPFERVTANEGDTIFAHLAKLASQRGVLVSSTPDGDLLFHKATTSKQTVGTIEEGQPGALIFAATFDGRARYNVYKCITPDSGTSLAWDSTGDPKTVIARDNRVPLSRFLTFQGDDTTPGNIRNAAEWRRSKQMVDALSIPFPVQDWYAPNGELWQENTLVTIVSETLSVPNGFDFLIRSVEYQLDSNRRSAVLGLVPPSAYSGEPLGDVWG